MAQRDPEFVRAAVEIIEVELAPPPDGPTFCVDEKTGIGVRTPTAPGRPARREFEYVRHGTVDLLAAFCVNDGQVSGIVRSRHRSREFCELLGLLDRQVPFGQTIHLILDSVSLHRSAEVAVWRARRPWRPFAFHFLPVHSSWLSFIEVWFSILARKCLKRSDLADFAAAEQALLGFITTYNTHQAHAFTWRKGVRFYQRLKDKLAADGREKAA